MFYVLINPRLLPPPLFSCLSSCSVDASAAMQVRALKDYCNNYDLTSLNIKAGDIITVQPFNNDNPKLKSQPLD